MLLFRQMLVLLLIMFIGYVAAKINIIDEASNKKISSLVVNIANPAMILLGGCNSQMDGMLFGKILLLALILFGALILLSFVIVRVLRIPSFQAGVYRCMFIFSNVGFMGIPLVHTLYGDQAVLYVSIFLIPFNILFYTFGISQMGGESRRFEWKRVINMGVIACLMAVIITLFKIPLPNTITSTATYLGNLTLPLSMLVIGASFVQIHLRELAGNLKLDLFVAVKMLLIPILGVIILKRCGVQGMLLGVCMVLLSAPVGSMNAMLSQQYEGDYLTATKGIALSTICSVATMPIVSFFI